MSVKKKYLKNKETPMLNENQGVARALPGVRASSRRTKIRRGRKIEEK